MADQAKLQELKRKLSESNSTLDEQEVKRLLLKDQVTPEEFQTVWNGISTRNAKLITERLRTFFGEDGPQNLTAFAAFGEVFADQVSDYEFREAFLDDQRQREESKRKDAESAKRRKAETKPETGSPKSEIGKKKKQPKPQTPNP